MDEKLQPEQNANKRQPLRLNPWEIGGGEKKDEKPSLFSGLNGYYDHYKEVPKRSLSTEEMGDLQEIGTPYLVDDIREEIRNRLERIKAQKTDPSFKIFNKDIDLYTTITGLMNKGNYGVVGYYFLKESREAYDWAIMRKTQIEDNPKSNISARENVGVREIRNYLEAASGLLQRSATLAKAFLSPKLEERN